MIENYIVEQAAAIFTALSNLEVHERISTINQIKIELKKHSPFANEPVDCVIWVPNEEVQANDYNPNAVPPPEMRLLEVSIMEDGFTQPIVTVEDKRADRNHTVIDGFHRNRVAKECKGVKNRLMGYLPIASVGDESMPLERRMAMTIRHNRARGSHDVDLMSNIVADLHELGRTDTWIAKHLGMDPDEILRLKQITGLAALFKNREYSKSWE